MRRVPAYWKPVGPLHEVQQMLGHANIEQTSTYLNATLDGLHESMRTLDRKRNAEARKARTPRLQTACKQSRLRPSGRWQGDGGV